MRVTVFEILDLSRVKIFAFEWSACDLLVTAAAQMYISKVFFCCGNSENEINSQVTDKIKFPLGYEYFFILEHEMK